METEGEGVTHLAGLRRTTSKEQKQVQWKQCPGRRLEHRQGPGCNLSAVGHLNWTKLPPAQPYYICYLIWVAQTPHCRNHPEDCDLMQQWKFKLAFWEETSSPGTSAGLDYNNEPARTLFLLPSSEVLQIAFTNVSTFWSESHLWNCLNDFSLLSLAGCRDSLIHREDPLSHYYYVFAVSRVRD